MEAIEKAESAGRVPYGPWRNGGGSAVDDEGGDDDLLVGHEHAQMGEFDPSEKATRPTVKYNQVLVPVVEA